MCYVQNVTDDNEKYNEFLILSSYLLYAIFAHHLGASLHSPVPPAPLQPPAANQPAHPGRIAENSYWSLPYQTPPNVVCDTPQQSLDVFYT